MSEYYPDIRTRQIHPILVAKVSSHLGCLIFLTGLFLVLGISFFNEQPAVGYGLFAIALVFVGIAVYRIMRTMILGAPVFQVSANPLFLGEDLVGSFSQRVKRKIHVNKVTLTLTCREWARYQQGTQTHSVTHVLSEQHHVISDIGDVSGSDVIKGEFQFKIRDNAMHSFLASDNKIQWFITAKTDVANWPDGSYQVDLEVAPVVLAH
jgi:hypothetical protein